jgi:hypothetical protein
MTKILVMKVKNGEPTRSALISRQDWPYYEEEGWSFVAKDPGLKSLPRKLAKIRVDNQ